MIKKNEFRINNEHRWKYTKNERKKCFQWTMDNTNNKELDGFRMNRNALGNKEKKNKRWWWRREKDDEEKE